MSKHLSRPVLMSHSCSCRTSSNEEMGGRTKISKEIAAHLFISRPTLKRDEWDLVPTSLLSWSLPSSVSFSIHDRSDQEKRRDQAVTKILTSSSKFSGSYVLTLQTMKWDPENGWRGDEERLPGRTNLVYNPGGRSIILHLMLDS